MREVKLIRNRCKTTLPEIRKKDDMMIEPTPPSTLHKATKIQICLLNKNQSSHLSNFEKIRDHFVRSFFVQNKTPPAAVNLKDKKKSSI